MPNHFHLLIKVRGSDELEGFLQAKKQRIKTLFIPKEHTQEKLYNFIVGRQFHNFLGGYSKAFNKFHNRKGSLMRQNTRRKIVDDENYLVNAIMYIHLNPVLHGFTSHP
jgi:REP element-mobilizing transposase RayT